MIALIGANPELAAMSSYDNSSYTGGLPAPANSEPEHFSFDGWMIIPIFFFLFLMSMAITILIITMKGGTIETSWQKEKAIIEQKCIDRGGKLVYAKFAGDICVIDIDKEMK